MKTKNYLEDGRHILCDSTVVVAVTAVVRTRPQAIPLATITMRKSIHGLPLVFYMGMGLRLAERAASQGMFFGIFVLNGVSFPFSFTSVMIALYWTVKNAFSA